MCTQWNGTDLIKIMPLILEWSVLPMNCHGKDGYYIIISGENCPTSALKDIKMMSIPIGQ